jgi:hypothetical protein
MGDIKFSDFYVNGKRADFTRYPQEGTLAVKEVENPSTELHTHSRWFIADKNDLEIMRHFKNFEDCFISYNHYWVDEHTPIQSYDLETGKIVCEYASRYSISLKHPRSALNYIIENTAEGFKNPNEWYYDKTTKKLYYLPEDPQVDPEDIVGYIPIADKLWQIEGTLEEKIENVVIRRFDMAYTKGDYRSLLNVTEDFPNGFASDAQSMCSAYGSINFSHAAYCAVEACHLFCLGVHGIVAEYGVHHLRIQKNVISHIGAGAVRINGGAYGSPIETHTFGNSILDNQITHCGKRYYSGCGILLMHSYENVVAHNEISWLYYSGISCGWNWGYKESISHHNLIEKNYIHHIGQGKLSDMGGIYLLGKQPGTIVRNNVIHDVESKHYGGWGLYTDEGSSYMLLENNICYRISSNGFYQHYGQMNTVRNNIFALSKDAPVRVSRKELHTGVILENNICIMNGTPAYQTGYDEKRAGCLHVMAASRNFFCDLQQDHPVIWRLNGKDFSLEEMQQKFGYEKESLVIPLPFKDLLGNDFNLKDANRLKTLGFMPIDYADCGVRR